jgi:hypothetical protein
MPWDKKPVERSKSVERAKKKKNKEYAKEIKRI